MKRVTVPMDLVKRAIAEAKYIGGMKECLCRAGNDCKDYPHDLACLFLNMGGKVVVDHGMAVELTAEEAFARVDRAANWGSRANRCGFKSNSLSGVLRTGRWIPSWRYASAVRAVVWD